MVNFKIGIWYKIGIFVCIFTSARYFAGEMFDLRAVCGDGWRSGSIGRQGACSHHGGVDRSAATLANLICLGLGVISANLIEIFNVVVGSVTPPSKSADSEYPRSGACETIADSYVSPRLNSEQQAEMLTENRRREEVSKRYIEDQIRKIDAKNAQPPHLHRNHPHRR